MNKHQRGKIRFMKQPDRLLDLRGNITPLSLLKATKALAYLDPGQRLEIIGTDEQTRQELLEILDRQQFRMVKVESGNAFYRIVLERMTVGSRF